MKQSHSNKYILCESNKKQSQLSLNLSKSQQKIFCKSVHDQIKERALSKENTQRSQNNTQTQRLKQEGSLSNLIGSFFARKASAKQLNLEKTVEESTILNSKIVEDRLKAKIVQIKDLKEQLSEKEKEILFLNQQLNVRLSGCPKCDRQQLIINKLKQQLNTQHEQFMGRLSEMEQPDYKLPISSAATNSNLLSGLLDNKLQNQKVVVKELLQHLLRLDSGLSDMDQTSQQLLVSLQMDKQDLLQQIYNQKQEIQQLRENETQLKEKIKSMSDAQIRLFQETVLYKSQQNNKTKLDREVQVNFDTSIVHSKSKLISSLDKLQNQSDNLIQQARSLY